MIIRSAFLEGSVPLAAQPDFDRHMQEVVLREIGTYPGIRRVALRKMVAADAGATGAYMQFDLYFDSLADMESALASPVRQQVQAKIRAGMGPFTGRVFHVVSEAVGAP